jgi:hypothetical protein
MSQREKFANFIIGFCMRRQLPEKPTSTFFFFVNKWLPSEGFRGPLFRKLFILFSGHLTEIASVPINASYKTPDTPHPHLLAQSGLLYRY